MNVMTTVLMVHVLRMMNLNHDVRVVIMMVMNRNDDDDEHDGSPSR